MCVCVFDCTIYRATVKVSTRMSHSTAALVSFSLYERKSKSTSLQADVGACCHCLALLRVLITVISLVLRQLLIHHTASLVASIGNAWCYFRHEWNDAQSLFFLHSVTLPQMGYVSMDCNWNLNLIRCFSQSGWIRLWFRGLELESILGRFPNVVYLQVHIFLCWVPSGKC